jgi:WD40-like Beta Propeller Repeat
LQKARETDAAAGALGLAEVFAVWALLAVFAGAIFWTYARLPAREFFHVSTSGPSGGAGRALVFVNFPVSLVAIAIVLVVVDRLRRGLALVVAALAIALCAVVFWPGVVEQRDLDARWVNALPAIGVLLALGLTAAAARGRIAAVDRAPLDRLRLVLAVAVALLALEYVSGEFGVFVERVPGLAAVFQAREPSAGFGHATLRPAVHLGHHHGFDGALLALAALTLTRVLGSIRRRGVRTFLGVYLGVMFAYGLANEVQDVWGEQLVKRGVTGAEIPSLLVPAATVPFAAVIVAGILVYLLALRRASVVPVRSGRWVPRAPFLLPAAAAAALVILGVTAAGATVRTPLPLQSERAELRVEGPIAFSMVDRGWDVMVARGDGSGRRNVTPDEHRDLAPRRWRSGQLAFQSDRRHNADVFVGARRLTDDEHADGEAAWSPDGRRIAFVSTRDGNRELYVMRSDGRGERRLTRGAAADEWPRWSPDDEIVFQRERDGDFDLYVTDASRSRVRRLTNLRGDERGPAWSHDGSLVAFSSNRGGDYDLYVVGTDGSGLRRVLAAPGDEFAAAWSPRDRFLVFTSNLDGRDQLFVVRLDGSGFARLTAAEADKDTPDWG